MIAIFIKLIPVILIFPLGYVLKKIGLFKPADGDLFLKLVFYLALPALILLSMTRITLSYDFMYLPVTAIAIVFATCIISFVAGKLLRLERASFGVFLTGTMIMNTNFLIPFFIAAYGEEGLARALLFDIGNSFLAFTFVYFLACTYGAHGNNTRALMKKFLLSPPLWALIVAVLLNLGDVRIPAVLNDFFQVLGNMTIPLIMLSLGVYFNPRITALIPLCSAIAIRMLLGLSLGFLFVTWFKLEGLTKAAVLISAAAPVGYNTLTFALLEKLDKEFAASIVSVSLLIGMIFIPFLIGWLA